MKRSFLHSRHILLESRPLVVGTLTGPTSVSSQLKKARAAGVDLLELRLDGFPKAHGAFQKAYEFGKSVIREIKTKTHLPILLTFRAHDERGPQRQAETINDKRRMEILARLLPSVDMVDVEIRRPQFARQMTVVAHVHGVDVIHSVHDFHTPGRLRELEKWSRRSLELKGDVFKVAVSPHLNDQLEDFLFWGKDLKNPRKILIGMGPVGVISRVTAFSFGSLLTYGHLGQSTAPGQMSARDLVVSIHDVYR